MGVQLLIGQTNAASLRGGCSPPSHRPGSQPTSCPPLTTRGRTALAASFTNPDPSTSCLAALDAPLRDPERRRPRARLAHQNQLAAAVEGLSASQRLRQPLDRRRHAIRRHVAEVQAQGVPRPAVDVERRARDVGDLALSAPPRRHSQVSMSGAASPTRTARLRVGSRGRCRPGADPTPPAGRRADFRLAAVNLARCGSRRPCSTKAATARCIRPEDSRSIDSRRTVSGVDQLRRCHDPTEADCGGDHLRERANIQHHPGLHRKP